MSWAQYCDICGAAMDDQMRGTLHVSNFNDGYNTNDYDCEVDICKTCILKLFDKEILVNGRIF